MNHHDSMDPPPSLSRHFEAPDDFHGHFGWLCGYSADEGFLDRAVERFTRRTKNQRAYEGRICLALLLDPSNEQIQPTQVPGVFHAGIKVHRPFKLLHAKVALLGFRHTSEARWLLRLIVTTGNWTRATLEGSLDLVWCIEISSEDLKARDSSLRQLRADFRAAWKMLAWLRQFFDCDLLNAKRPERQNTESASATVESWIEQASAIGKDNTPRFLDNRKASLLAQLPKRIRKHAADSSRNYLALGSGFYETPDESNRTPPVLQIIVDSLQEEELLTKQPEIDVFVNPRACQAVANSLPACTAAGWTVRRAGKPEYMKEDRFLHAKFLFSAGCQNNSNKCNSPWLYLGSGNLTGPGFANPMSSHGGNLEAGVVFAPESLRWEGGKGIPDECVVTNVLPLQWDDEFNQTQDLSPGIEMPEPQTRYCAAPVSFLFWIDEGDSQWLRASKDVVESVDLLDESSNRCPRESIKGFRWNGAKPRQVIVRWHENEHENQAWVPVIDEFGRIAATTLQPIDIEEAWGQLASFPMPPEEEELPPVRPDKPEKNGPVIVDRHAAVYPVRQMMELIENIAAKQTAVCHADWTTWCTRLEQCLIQAAESEILKEFLKLDVNPLSPLWNEPFRPDFASSGETEEGRRYEEALKRVEAAWKVATLRKIGVQE